MFFLFCSSIVEEIELPIWLWLYLLLFQLPSIECKVQLACYLYDMTWKQGNWVPFDWRY